MVDLAPVRAFEAFISPLAIAPMGHPLIVDEVQARLATVMARDGQTAAIGAALSFDLPGGPVRSAGPDLAMIGTGPGVWLAVGDGVTGLADRLAGLASVADQSSGYAVLRLQGPAARDLLSRGAFIDFHPDSFGPGSAAVTTIAHMGVIIWQVDGDMFVALFRSYARSFWDWLIVTAAGMGVVPLRHRP